MRDSIKQKKARTFQILRMKMLKYCDFYDNCNLFLLKYNIINIRIIEYYYTFYQVKT